MTHTKGPWKVMGTEDEGFTIASCNEEGNADEPIIWQQGGIDYRPNAVLMAAAPNLLYVCKMAAWILEPNDAEGQPSIEARLIMRDAQNAKMTTSAYVLSKLREAIAAAVEPEPPELPFYDS
jgi:hypothetical protein